MMFLVIIFHEFTTKLLCNHCTKNQPNFVLKKSNHKKVDYVLPIFFLYNFLSIRLRSCTVFIFRKKCVCFFLVIHASNIRVSVKTFPFLSREFFWKLLGFEITTNARAICRSNELFLIKQKR